MLNTQISVYGIMILLSLLANIPITAFAAKKYGFTNDECIGALLYENFGIIFGAKLLTAIQVLISSGEFNISRAGFSSYGAVIGAIVCVTIFGWQFKKPIQIMLFTFMPSIPLMYAIGKMGCFIAGCCYGIEYGGWGHIIYRYSQVAPAGVNVFPVQFAEAAIYTFIFAFMFIETIKNKFDLKTLGVSYIMCGSGKLALDFLRMEHAGQIFSLNQAISVFFIVIGLSIAYAQV